MRYRLRTLLILMAFLPPLLAGAWFGYREYESRRRAHLEWGGTIVLENLEPIEWEKLEEKIRDTIAP